MLNTEYKFGEVRDLASQINAADAKVQFHGIFSNDNGGAVLLAFKGGQKLDTHVAPAEVMVLVIEGEIEFTILEKKNIIKAGEFLLLGADVPHSVVASKDSKVMLFKVKSDKA